MRAPLRLVRPGKVVRGRGKPYSTWEMSNRRTRKQAVDGVEIRLCSMSLSANNWEYWHVKSIAARKAVSREEKSKIRR